MTMTENSPVCLSDLDALQAQAPSVPTAPLDDPWAELEALARAATPGPWVQGRIGDPVGGEHVVDMGCPPKAPYVTFTKGWSPSAIVRSDGDRIASDAAFIAAANPDTVLNLIEAARQPSVGMEGEARNEQSPEPVKDQAEQGVEAVAWRWKANGRSVVSHSRAKPLFSLSQPGDVTDLEPLYSQETVSALQKREAGLREALRDCLAVIEMQERRNAGEFHLSPDAFMPIWERAKDRGRQALGDQT